MSITILTPYKLFFITQSDNLFALMKDGRVLKIKKTPYFSTRSADEKTLTGISFDGEHTHILSMPFGFDIGQMHEIASLFGYFYYPCLGKSTKKMAIIEADLLKPRPEGELRIYNRKITKWYQGAAFEAKMKPPFISPKDDSLFFIDNQNRLMIFQEKAKEPLRPIAQNVLCFAVSKNQTKIASYNGTSISVWSLLEKKEIMTFSATFVTALGFDNTEQEVFYAISNENRYAIYAQPILSAKTTLLIETEESINSIYS